MKPTIGRIVIYRSRTGDYDVPAIVTATQATLNRKGVEGYVLGYVPDLSSEEHVHLTVFTPGIPGDVGHAVEEAEFKVRGAQPAQPNMGGSYPEWGIPPALDGGDVAPGTWRWPERV
jgi:hypothetical protein